MSKRRALQVRGKRSRVGEESSGRGENNSPGESLGLVDSAECALEICSDKLKVRPVSMAVCFSSAMLNS